MFFHLSEGNELSDDCGLTEHRSHMFESKTLEDAYEYVENYRFIFDKKYRYWHLYLGGGSGQLVGANHNVDDLSTDYELNVKSLNDYWSTRVSF